MFRRFLLWFAYRVLGRPRVIANRDGTGPYLSRWYLFGRPSMPDGSWPFDVHGGPREGVRWPRGWGLYLHRFHASDDDRDPHNHPFRWALSLILSGGYLEERLDLSTRGLGMRVRRLRPGRLNFIRANDYHRVNLLRGDAWSLFLAGPKSQHWGFLELGSGKYWPHRQYYRTLSERERNPGFAGEGGEG